MFGNGSEAYRFVLAADRAMVANQPARAADLLSRALEYRTDVDTLLRLAAVRKVLHQYEAAIGAASAAVQLAPRHFLALLTLATLRDAIGAEHRAGRTYREALRYAPPVAELPPAVRKQLDWARRRVAAEDEWLERVRDWSIAA